MQAAPPARCKNAPVARTTQSFWARSLLFGSHPASSLNRIYWAFAALIAVTVFGTVGYMLLGLTLVEAIYQTVFTSPRQGRLPHQPASHDRHRARLHPDPPRQQ